VPYNEVAVGWPFLAMYERNFVGDPPNLPSEIPKVETEGLRSLAMTLPLRDQVRNWLLCRTTRLPIIPIWPGFVLNVLFYAVVWLGGSFVVRRVLDRRRVRRCRKRGVCVTRGCGYELKGLGVCPECGVAQDPGRLRDRGSVDAESEVAEGSD